VLWITVYVSDDAFERRLVRVVDAEPPYVRAWAHGSWGNDLLEAVVWRDDAVWR
jgi:hypothetical protein